MTLNDVYELRRQGNIEDAYNAAREVYAHDKGPQASKAMFWAAVDMLRHEVSKGNITEAEKIFKAIERLLINIGSPDDNMTDAIKRCGTMLHKERQNADSKNNFSTPTHHQTGVWGEEMAVAYLREKGYVILERDWHSSHRDIDIIAQQRDCIVFVEVKARRNNDLMEPEQAVDYKKQRNLRYAINHYLHYCSEGCLWRFDVITVIGQPGCTNPQINHIEDFALSRR
jgi:Holliday junction resolvase-like predicted endonuclease